MNATTINQISKDGRRGLHGEEIEGLYEAAKEIEAKRILEIGTHGGTSALTFCHVLTETGGHLWCVDPVISDGFLARLKTYGFASLVTPIARWSPWLLGESAKIDLPLDFVFIDGNHSMQAAMMDFLYWFPQVRAGGRIACHDWWMPSVHTGITLAEGVVGKSVKRLRIIGKRCGIMIWTVNGCHWAPRHHKMQGEATA